VRRVPFPVLDGAVADTATRLGKEADFLMSCYLLATGKKTIAEMDLGK
jgi:hypothetical protein